MDNLAIAKKMKEIIDKKKATISYENAEINLLKNVEGFEISIKATEIFVDLNVLIEQKGLKLFFDFYDLQNTYLISLFVLKPIFTIQGTELTAKLTSADYDLQEFQELMEKNQFPMKINLYILGTYKSLNEETNKVDRVFCKIDAHTK